MPDKPGKAMIFACSGASNCGQITNAVAVKLASEELVIMSCLAGIGSHTQKYVDGALNAGRVVAIDGCAVACTKKTLEHAQIPVSAWICVTDEGIKKTSGRFEYSPDDLSKVYELVMVALQQK